MFRISGKTAGQRLPRLIPVFLSALFIFLYPMNDDVAFSRLESKGRTMRFIRSGTDSVISVPLRFRKKELSWIPPLPDYHWDDLTRTAEFRKELPELYTAGGLRRTRFFFFAGFINVSTLPQLKSRTFYLNMQYKQSDFPESSVRKLMQKAALAFCRQLKKRKIICSPAEPSVIRRAGNPLWIVFSALSKILIVLVPMSIAFFLLLLMEKRRKITVFNGTILSLSVFGVYFTAHLLLLGKLFVPFLLLLAALLFFVLYSYRDRLRIPGMTAGKICGAAAIFYLALILIQYEAVFSPQFHILNTSDSRITQKFTISFSSAPRKKSQFAWHTLPETTLFMRKILRKEPGMRSARMLRVYLANPQYKCLILKPSVKPVYSGVFAMEYDNNTISSGGKRKVPESYYLSMFRYFRESYSRFLADMGATLNPEGEPELLDNLSPVPFPLRRRAVFALILILLFFLLLFSLRKTEQS